MNWRDLFVIQPIGRTVRGQRPPIQAGSTTGAFVTTQSITSFPVASAVVFAVWKGVGSISTNVALSKITPLVVALGVGSLVYLATLTDVRVRRPQGLVQWGSSVGIACVNCVLLWVGALGMATLGPSGSAG